MMFDDTVFDSTAAEDIKTACVALSAGMATVRISIVSTRSNFDFWPADACCKASVGYC